MRAADDFAAIRTRMEELKRERRERERSARREHDREYGELIDAPQRERAAEDWKADRTLLRGPRRG